MRSLKELWKQKESPEKLKNIQTIAKRILVIFFLFLLFFYLLSRVSASLTTPQVQTTHGKASTIEHKTSIEGKLEAEATTPIFVKDGAPILSVSVRTGDTVEEGQSLFTYDPKKVQDEIAQKQIDLRSTQAEYQVALSNQANLNQRSENTQIDSEEDLDSQLKESNLQVEKALSELEISRKALNDAEKAKNSNSFVSENESTGKEPSVVSDPVTVSPENTIQEGLSGDSSPSLTPSDTNPGSDSNTTQNNDETNSNNLKNDYQSKQYAYTEALQQRDVAMEKAERAVRDSKLVDASATVKTLSLSIELKQMELSILQKSIADNGTVCAPIGGIVSSVNIKLGELTPSTSAILLSDQPELIFKSEITKEQMKYISREDALTLKISSEKETINNLTIKEIRAVEDKTDVYELYALLPKNIGILGETVSGTISQESEKYSLTIPLSALYEEKGQKYYVYIIKEESSALGTVTMAIKTSVKIESKNDEIAAVTGAFTTSDSVITSSTTPLKDRLIVRTAEE